MTDELHFTTLTYPSGIDPAAVARLKQRREAELAALTLEQRALIEQHEAEVMRQFLFGDSC